VCYQKELGKKMVYDGSRKAERVFKVKPLYLEATGTDEIQPREATEDTAWSRVEMRV
jgi:hypothetical protein